MKMPMLDMGMKAKSRSVNSLKSIGKKITSSTSPVLECHG